MALDVTGWMNCLWRYSAVPEKVDQYCLRSAAGLSTEAGRGANRV